MEKQKIICIVGPTASGKTGWGVEIAKKFGGEIVSADSRQVYKGLDIGTGKDLKEYGAIKYHLIDICRPGEKFTMFDWLGRARATVEDIFSRSKTPIIVGGTGLYIQALIEGFELEQSKKLKVKSKKYSRANLESKTLKQLQNIYLKFEIRNLPTGSAKARKLEIDVNNPHRLIRAIERAQSGEVVSKKKPDFEALQIAADLSREVLYQRIDDRVESRFKDGMLEEVQGLIKAGIDKKWLLSLGLEYRILTEFLLKNPKSEIRSTKQRKSNSNVSNLKNSNLDIVSNFDIRDSSFEAFDDMRQKMKYTIHAYARRQLTWFRRFPEIVWCKDLKSAEKEVRKFLK